MKYLVTVFETRSVECVYEIEAASTQAALVRADAGDTDAERETGKMSVIDRTIYNICEET